MLRHLCRCLKKIFLNPKGLSLVEITIGAGLIGGIGMGIMELLNNQTKMQKNNEISLEATSLVQQIQYNLAKQDYCGQSLAGRNPHGTTGAEFTTIKDNLGNTIFQKGSAYSNIEIVDMRVFNFTPNNAQSGMATIRIRFKKKGNSSSALLNKITSRDFFTSVVLTAAGASGTIATCNATSTNQDAMVLEARQKACLDGGGRFVGEPPVCVPTTISSTICAPNWFVVGVHRTNADYSVTCGRFVDSTPSLSANFCDTPVLSADQPRLIMGVQFYDSSKSICYDPGDVDNLYAALFYRTLHLTNPGVGTGLCPYDSVVTSISGDTVGCTLIRDVFRVNVTEICGCGRQLCPAGSVVYDVNFQGGAHHEECWGAGDSEEGYKCVRCARFQSQITTGVCPYGYLKGITNSGTPICESQFPQILGCATTRMACSSDDTLLPGQHKCQAHQYLAGIDFNDIQNETCYPNGDKDEPTRRIYCCNLYEWPN